MVRDTDTGNRARCAFQRDPGHGLGMMQDDDGVEQPVEWFGYKSAFEVDFGVTSGFVPDDVASTSCATRCWRSAPRPLRLQVARRRTRADWVGHVVRAST